jgi:hemerythrin
MGVIWVESYETGNAEIDRQHHELLDLVSELEAAEKESPDSLYRVLDHVMDFTVTHFLREEKLMDEVGYPAEARDEMIAQHQEFVGYARLRFIEFREGALVSVLPLQAFLVGWLTLHEFGLDRLLADFIAKQAE